MARIKYFNSKTGKWEYADSSGGSGGGVSSWNDLTDKPFGEEIVMVDPTFDGDLTGREAVQIDEGAYLVKVSPQYVPVSEMIGATLVVDVDGTETSCVLTEENALDAFGVLGITGSLSVLDGMFATVSVPQDGSLGGITLTAGTWFFYGTSGQVAYTKSLSCLTSGEYEVVKKLDEKYLPESPIMVVSATGASEDYSEIYCNKTCDDVLEASRVGKIILMSLFGFVYVFSGSFHTDENDNFIDAEFVQLLDTSVAVSLDKNGVLRLVA